MQIVTSIGPTRLGHTRSCIDTWKQYNVPILTVQTPQDNYLDNFPDVQVVTDTRTGTKVRCPNNPRLCCFIDLVDQPTLIINCDIHLRDDPQTFYEEWTPRPNTLSVGIRHEVFTTEIRLNPYGIDAFLLTPDMVPHLSDDLGFCIGFPGWDYWIPWHLHHKGYAIHRTNSVLHHKVHPQGYPHRSVGIAQQILSKTYKTHRRTITKFIQDSTNRTGMTR